MNQSKAMRAAISCMGRCAGRVGVVILMVVVVADLMHGQSVQRNMKRTRTAPAVAKTAESLPDVQFKQGFNFRAWLGSNSAIGLGAFPDFSPPDLIGVEYPVGSGIEHLYGGGIWVGAIVDTGRTGIPRLIRAVTTGYGGGSGGFVREIYGHQFPKDTFYTTSILQTGRPNRRHEDDDADGRIDEDELDGFDNDGDWRQSSDDVGSDGFPDSLEEGCEGAYDPVSNPDPAHDNYDPLRRDMCRELPRMQDDPTVYSERNGIADIGEPHVDEDYGAVSEQDVYVSYTDTFTAPTVPGHIPLGLKVWQRSYAWASRVKEPLIILEYNIINVGGRTLDSVYLGFFADTDVGPISYGGYYGINFSGYLSDVRTAYAYNAVLRPSTPIGFTVLGTPRPLSALRYTFQWHAIEDNPSNDRAAYDYMSSGDIKPNEPISPGSDTQNFLGFGPFEVMHPGDTLRIVMGMVSGEGIEQGANNLKQNAVRALELYSRGYTTPEVPPSPPLRIEKGDDRVTLTWDWRPGDARFDPLLTWDDSNKFVDVLPDTHWRRVNPPPRHSRGGRIFEGFRLWRSESPTYNPRSFALVRQYDVKDDLNFEFNAGIEYSYVDSNLVRGKRYWYAVTSFSVPGASIVIIPDPEGGPPAIDTLITDPVESDVSQNVQLAQLPFSPSTGPEQVKVVPNPYRTDADYTFEGGGWEGLGRFWTESRRVIWFVHLPAVATIRVFTLSGDIVTTIEHDDAVRNTPDKPPGQEEWNLLSSSGRAIASGLYIFTVESSFGRQIGKFVIIR